MSNENWLALSNPEPVINTLVGGLASKVDMELMMYGDFIFIK